ncbi:hypothetical protein GCM10022243_14390 [Saccharothrix violaceirubra]|uniref:Uncharacterized protein n=1 Tax=Saccharothrix violaceirubra TaxID=413306 RepID=A0A7W7T672_9PSEU|nr:hypothetical protein [Saccharothrix violaceirubra]MBB4967314.1 hypothetical protein [Saccharothrix violaceirubra]
MTPPVLDTRADVDPLLPGIAFGIVGVCTLLVYLLAIRRGFLDRRSTLPVFAACANVSWEITYAFVYPVDSELRVVLYFWLPLNLVLLWQALRFGRQDFPGLSRPAFAAMTAGWSVFAFAFMVLATREFGDRDGSYTTVFVVVLMEALFLTTLRVRGSTVGQTMYIALLKTVIDASGAVGLVLLYPDRRLLHLMVAAEIVLDVAYAVLLHRRFRAEGANPWRKV